MKPNYAYEKRQRELEKKRRKEDKAHRKATATAPPGPSRESGPKADRPAMDVGAGPAV